jgi:hypothetical protein
MPSYIPLATNVSPTQPLFAPLGSGGGPGQTVSSFNNLTTSTLIVSSISNAAGDSLIQMNAPNFDSVRISTAGGFSVVAATAATIFSPLLTQIIAGRTDDPFGKIALQASTIQILRNVSSLVQVPTTIVSLGGDVLQGFSSLTVSSINGAAPNGGSAVSSFNTASVSSLTVSSITVDTPTTYISHNRAASTLVLANTENGVNIIGPSLNMSANTNLSDGVSSITFAQLISSVRG